MNHQEAIVGYINTMTASPDINVIIIEGPPGWGKSHATSEALIKSGNNFISVGAHVTPLYLYNFLYKNPHSVILIDDCAGLLEDKSAMAVIKSATWPTKNKQRLLKWGSTSSRVEIPEFEFFGKLIIVCNSFPNNPDGAAVRSRGIARKIMFSVDEATHLLNEAAANSEWFKNTDLAKEVAALLIKYLNEDTVNKISYRTLATGYRIAEINPENWQELLATTLPCQPVKPEIVIENLAKQHISVKEQLKAFKNITGMSERSFYSLRARRHLDNAI